MLVGGGGQGDHGPTLGSVTVVDELFKKSRCSLVVESLCMQEGIETGD